MKGSVVARRSWAARALVAVVASALIAGALLLGRDPATPAAQAGPAISVLDAYVREPATDDVAAAYFRVRNDGGAPDTLIEVRSGAAATVALHDLPGSTGAGEHAASGPLLVPAGQTVALSPGQGHVMLERPAVTLRPGDIITLTLTFTTAGPIEVAAPVIAIGVEPPGGRP